MKTNHESACSELKIKLIQEIIAADCGKLKHFSGPKFSLGAMLSYEITEEEKNDEVNALSGFNKLNIPSNFKVSGFEDVIKTHIFDSDYLHIYFVLVNTDVNLLFRFNGCEENPVGTAPSNDTFYLLVDKDLVSILYSDAKVLMDDFVNEYDNYYGVDSSKKITTYITHYLGRIRQNFYRFEEETELIMGAKQDASLQRMNIILSIPASDCKVPPISGEVAFYDFGALRP